MIKNPVDYCGTKITNDPENYALNYFSLFLKYHIL